MMSNLLNVIVAAALILTFAFASELGPRSRNAPLRAGASPSADAGPVAAASYDPDKTVLPID